VNKGRSQPASFGRSRNNLSTALPILPRIYPLLGGGAPRSVIWFGGVRYFRALPAGAQESTSPPIGRNRPWPQARFVCIDRSFDMRILLRSARQADVRSVSTGAGSEWNLVREVS